jgi:hypothetical protein
MEEENPINQKTICQSCGMPMKINEDFGTEINGEKNQEYCIFCYKEGRFVEENISLQEQINKIVKLSVEQLGLPEELARKMAEIKIPKLKRWKDKDNNIENN